MGPGPAQYEPEDDMGAHNAIAAPTATPPTVSLAVRRVPEERVERKRGFEVVRGTPPLLVREACCFLGS